MRPATLADLLGNPNNQPTQPMLADDEHIEEDDTEMDCECDDGSLDPVLFLYFCVFCAESMFNTLPFLFSFQLEIMTSQEIP